MGRLMLERSEEEILTFLGSGNVRKKNDVFELLKKKPLFGEPQEYNEVGLADFFATLAVSRRGGTASFNVKSRTGASTVNFQVGWVRDRQVT